MLCRFLGGKAIFIASSINLSEAAAAASHKSADNSFSCEAAADEEQRIVN